MHLPEGGGRQLGSPGSLRGVGSRASEYRAGGGMLKGWEVHHGRFVRPSRQALSLGPANELPLDYPLPPPLSLLCQIEFAF